MKAVRLLKTVVGLNCYLDDIRCGHFPVELCAQGRTASQAGGQPVIGFVPTMGALHAGHLSLIQRSRQECDIVVVSIFVNPLQFGPNEDFEQYPRTLEADAALCEQAGVDAIFAPSAQELYGSSLAAATQTQVIPPQSMMANLCGKTRPGHFEGVATIVAKLLNIVRPHRAYFGQKDAQQVAILRRLVDDLNLPVKLVVCPIVREPSGLAYSSRNQYLTAEQRVEATVLSQSLQQAKQRFDQGCEDATILIETVKEHIKTNSNFRIDYVDLVHPDTIEHLELVKEAGLLVVAAYLGNTRLIDNLVLRNRKPIIAIDGPAGAGKSTVARRVAHELDLLYLDTGAMYRAVTWLVMQSGLNLDDRPAIAELVNQCQIQLQPGTAQDGSDKIPLSRVWVNGEEVTQAIRSADVTRNVSAIAAQPVVRQELTQRQQSYGREGGVVMEGRDIGTHVFPDAELKIFLTASVQERARRRQQDLKDQNQPVVDLDELERMIYERDRKDSTRATAPLRQAEDAVEIQTDDLTIDQVIEQIVTHYRQLPKAVAN